MTTRITVLLAIFLAVFTLGVSAQTQTGTVEGRVADEQGGVLPGVTVTLTGRQGSQTTVTDSSGEYRFVGLTPGIYEVRAELAGFTTQAVQNIDVGLGKTLQVPLALKVGGLAESVEVTANASSIDTTSAASDNSLSQELLANMPINMGNFNAATSLLNYAPGVNSSSAFGGDSSYGNSLLIDGVDTRDPEGGSAWVFFNYNIVEEVQVGGVGAPAEYGGFSGAVVNTITKSGGNSYSGLFEYRHTNDGLASSNISDENLELNPSLGNANVLKKLNDYTVQLGGPFSKDRAFWWASVQRYAFEQDPVGPRTIQTEVSPRYNGKVTFQLTPNDTLIGSFQYDNYNVTGRAGFPGSTFSTDRQTVRQDSPEAVWNAQYRKVFGSNTFLEAKFTGYWGYYYLDPVDKTPARYDGDTGEYTGGAGYYYYADRARNQVNVSLSKYAEAYGRHNFKFGMEIERSKSRSRSEYMDNVYYYDLGGEPYLAYSGLNYDIDGRNKRESYYAQDAWQIGRLTANLGIRLDHIRGYSPNDDETVYTPKLGWGPRLGFAYDLLGKGTTVLKGFWGRYFEGASFNPWQRATSGYQDSVSYEVLPNGTLVEFDRVPSLIYGIDDDIDHLGLDEATLAFEQQLRRDMRFAVTGIWRDYGNFINSVYPAARYTTTSVTNRLTNQPMTLYRWANRSTTDEDVFIRNVKGFQYLDGNGNPFATLDPTRNYKGVMFVLTKSYSNRWNGQFSYVWSKVEGTVSNGGTTSVTGSFFENPNTSLVNSDGLMGLDRTHEWKLFGGYTIPWIEVALNAYYRAISGTTYQADMSVSGSTLNRSGSTTVYLEPRGSRRLDMLHQVDLRIDKSFRVDVHRFGVFLDFQNLFNNDTITGVQTRYPTRTISGNVVNFESPTAIQLGRQITFGGRWTF
jgi:hypothetical protein